MADNHRATEEEKMDEEVVELEGSDCEITGSQAGELLDNQSVKSTGLSDAAARIRVEVGKFKVLSGCPAVGFK